MQFYIGGVDILMASGEVFPLYWHLGLSEQLRDEEEDALNAAWMVQEGRSTFYSWQLPMEFFGKSLVELEAPALVLACCSGVWSISGYFQTSRLLETSWTIEQTFHMHRSLCSLVGPGRQGSWGFIFLGQVPLPSLALFRHYRPHSASGGVLVPQGGPHSSGSCVWCPEAQRPDYQARLTSSG